jgi:hypothetical protein
LVSDGLSLGYVSCRLAVGEPLRFGGLPLGPAVGVALGSEGGGSLPGRLFFQEGRVVDLDFVGLPLLQQRLLSRPGSVQPRPKIDEALGLIPFVNL